ncbi:bifunctional glycosyltransferase 87/phosphatase PAP2 family protein [Streptomyces boninensis]|uniref:bifunctional glycosyltransferase 87/phosphatase PAP2 family protein n=1 Tax=Streptomyces boninensis TaxID=2039455 RepID=UPI003B2126F7
MSDTEGYRAGLGTRSVVVLGALWVLAGVLAARLAAEVLRTPQEERLADLDAWIGPDGVLRHRGSVYDDGAFTGTPFNGLVLKPLTRAAEQGLGVVWTFGTLLLVVGLGVLAARALPEPVTRRTRLLTAPAAVSLIALSVPVRETFTLGQTSLLPVLLALGGWWLAWRGRSGGAALIGLAAALQPAVLLFAPVLWLTGRRGAAYYAGGTFAAATAAAWVAMPADSWAYWIHHIAGAGLGEPMDSAANQSLHGALLRLGLTGPVEIAVFLLLAAAVGYFAVRRAVHYARDGQLLLAAAIAGCGAIAIAPAAWQHEQLWLLLAVVGRTGARTRDRYVWPVFAVLVITFDGKDLVPNLAWLSFISDNVVLIAALLAATSVPFLSRTADAWAKPAPTRLLDRPNILLELLLIRIGYRLYSYVRSFAPDGRDLAEGHGDQILAIERFLHIDMEHWLNHKVASIGWLESSMNFYYASFHFLVPLSILGWLYATRPAAYRKWRASLAFATLFALIGFWAYPLAPPRLMPGLGYIDTANGPQDFDDPKFGMLTGVSNQYAAMPSLHVGWSLWCALVLWRLAPYAWLRWAGFLYPALTTMVIMGTANHYLLDAAGGVAVVAAGLFAARGLQRALAAGAATRAASGPSSSGPPDSSGRTTPDRPDSARQPERA